VSAPQPLTGDELAAITQRADAGLGAGTYDTLRLVAEVERLRAENEDLAAIVSAQAAALLNDDEAEATR
jgi:hypothetical protein